MPSPKGWKMVALPEQIYEDLKRLSVCQRRPIWKIIAPYLSDMKAEFLNAHIEEIKMLQAKLKSGEALEEILSRPDTYYTMLDGVIDLKSERIEEEAKLEIEEAEKTGGGVDIWLKKRSEDNQ